MTREQAVRELLAEYEQQRVLNRTEEERRLAEAGEKDPAIAAALKRREALLYDGMRNAFGDPAHAEEIVERLHARMREIHGGLRQALAAQCLPEDYLEPVYHCARCRDTGRVGEPLHEWCACFQQRLVTLLCSDEGMAALQSENFDTFNIHLFPEEALPGMQVTQREYMRTLRALCEQYADDFPCNAQRNLLFCGASGLGKSFLMNCIAHRVLSRGFSVVRTTATKLMDGLRRYHYNGEGAEQVAQWTGAQLLLLDDLGAEPMIENVTIVYLLSVINERMVAQRHTVVSTNFAPSELMQAYTERMTSRLLDKKSTRMLRFAGRDVRLLGQR